MTTPHRIGDVSLSVGDPPVYRTPYGPGCLVDFGDVVPVPFANFHAAVAEINARKNVPARPSGVEGGHALVPACPPSTAPGSFGSPQDGDPGAIYDSRPAVAVGAADRANTTRCETGREMQDWRFLQTRLQIDGVGGEPEEIQQNDRRPLGG
jgi:hypothetical protein